MCTRGAKLRHDTALCNNVLFILHVWLSETEWQKHWKPVMMIELEVAILDETGPLTRLRHVTTGGAFIMTLRNGYISELLWKANSKQMHVHTCSLCNLSMPK